MRVTSQTPQKVGKGTAGKASFQTTAENSYGWFGRDVAR